MNAVTIRAHAKINLDLRMLGTRPDGFHELRTVFQALALHDVLTVVPRPGPFALECDVPGVPLDGSNLIWKAASRLWHALRRPGEPVDVLVRLEKRIPMEAGLGGGSGDAAAALLALNQLWEPGLHPSALSEVAGTLGSDVPFFLEGGTALGLGRGEEIYPLADLPRQWVVLLIPAFGVSSREAYRWYDSDASAGTLIARPEQTMPGTWPVRASRMVNDLEGPVARRHPEIDQMCEALRQAGAGVAAMTGSGSTVYGLFPGQAEATAAMDALAGGPWHALVTESLDRVAYALASRPRACRANM